MRTARVDPCRDAVEAVIPQATIVIDKSHVVRMANQAVERARKALCAALTPAQRRGLMHDRFVLLKRQRELTDKERIDLDGWTERLRTIRHWAPPTGPRRRSMACMTPEDAAQRHEAWAHALTPDVRHYFADLLRAWSNWRP